MAFIKLFPHENSKALPVKEIIRRLRGEFALVHADPDEGSDHVAAMIVATLRFSDDLPHKQEQLARLQAVQNEAVYVLFGDSENVMARCCLMPDSALFFDDPD